MPPRPRGNEPLTPAWVGNFDVSPGELGDRRHGLALRRPGTLALETVGCLVLLGAAVSYGTGVEPDFKESVSLGGQGEAVAW